MKMFYVEVLKRGIEVEVITFRQGSTLAKARMQWEKDLIKDGYIVDSILAFSDRGMFYKYALKARLLELRAYCEYGNNLIDSITNEDIKKSTRNLLNDHEETLMMNVAKLTRRCLRREIEVDDELAIDCLNWWNNQLQCSTLN